MSLVKDLSIKLHNIFFSRWLPWVLVGLFVCLGILYLFLQPSSMFNWQRSNQILVVGVVLLGLLLAYLLITRVMDLYDQCEKLQIRLLESEMEVSRAYQRLQAIFQVGQKFVEATEENEVIEVVLRLTVDLAGAKGASFVPLDEHNHPTAAVNYGELPLPVMEPWLEYLASPTVRESCQNCENYGTTMTCCPLIKGPMTDTAGVFCLPLRRAGQEFGVLNIYMADKRPIELETQAFLGALVDETALALEGVRLRRKELAALSQIQSIRQKTDLRVLLNGLLESVHQTLEADTSLLVINPVPGLSEPIQLRIGELSEQLRPIVDGIFNGVLETGKPVVLRDVLGDPEQKGSTRSFLAVPLLSTDKAVVGAILVGSRRSLGFSQRQHSLLQTVAGQLTLIVQNTSLLIELEYKSMMEERKRLAREIHDGLAQTLGFLKLQAAQMKGYLVREEYEKARKTVEVYYETLSEAYLDARQAIDGLRIGLGDSGLQNWLEQIVAEFFEISGLQIELQGEDINSRLAPEIHAQLMRIVQEALSNVRKHARASFVMISYFEREGDFWLEIRDDGDGFSPEDISVPSRHGLRGMRERADLIGADFQIISRPGDGTIVRIRLPLQTSPYQETV